MDRAGAAGLVSSLLNWRSLRWKAAALVAVACSAVALVVGLLVHDGTEDRLNRESEGRAVTDLETAVRQYRTDGRAPSGTTVDSAELPPELLHRLRGPDQVVTWYEDGDPELVWLWAAQRVDGGLIALRIDVTPERRALHGLDRSILKSVLISLALVVPLAALITELLVSRLRRVARTAQSVAEGNLDDRVGRYRGGDEIAALARAVDSMAASLQQRLHTEQRFTADVAHELRTPVMGLITSAELLPEDEAAAMVRDRAGVLRDLVEDLLEISRLDAGAEQAQVRPVPLDEVVRESVARTGLSCALTVRDPARVETDPRRLERIVANLVVNAHRHGTPPVDVTVAGRTIVVRDHGVGFPRSLLAEGPQRFRTGTAERGTGHGLGLTIAAAQSALIGARLTFANAADGGALAALTLPGRG